MRKTSIRRFLLLLAVLFCFQFGKAQLSDTYFDTIDSLIEVTQQIDLCLKDGKEDLRFFSKTPEKYSDYKLVFARAADSTFSFEETSHFFCDIMVEINCEGKAGNYSVSIEPRTFTLDDYHHFLNLMNLIEKLNAHSFTPASYLGEKVNSKVKFRLAAKNGKLSLQ